MNVPIISSFHLPHGKYQCPFSGMHLILLFLRYISLNDIILWKAVAMPWHTKESLHVWHERSGRVDTVPAYSKTTIMRKKIIRQQKEERI